MASTNGDAYINGYAYDIFISYAHIDNQALFHEQYGWIEEFYNELNLLLIRRIGEAGAIKIWWDNKKLDGSMEFNSYIDKSIQQSAIIICLTSPAYLKSQYCQKELQTFYNKALLEPVGLYLNDRSRILNVLLNNIPYTKWPKELIGTTGFKFNDATEADNYGDPYDITSIGFKNNLKALRDAIIKLMEEFKANEQPVVKDKFTIFFGDVSDSLRQLKKRTIAELKAQKLEVVSDIPPPYEELEHESCVKEKLKQAKLSVHLLDQYPGREIEGNETVGYPQRQTLLSLGCPQAQLIWTPLEMNLEDVEEQDYKHFLQNLETDKPSNKDIRIIHGIKSELTRQIVDISSTLKTEGIKPTKERITVLLDTHYDDQLLALEISKQLIESGIQPYINPEDDDPKKNIIMLEDRISQVSKLVFFYGKVSYHWVAERIKSALQFIVSKKYPDKDFCIYMLPTHTDRGDLSSFNDWYVPIKIVDNSDALQQFLKS
jgi:hypothetical protein